MAQQPAPVAAQIPVIHAPQQSNTPVAPVQAVPGVVQITDDLSALPEGPFRTLGAMLMRSMQRNIEENNANLMLAIRQENDSRYAPRDEVEAMGERVRALERTMNRRIDTLTDDLGRIRDGVPDQPRLTAPGARQDRNNHARFADDFQDEDVQSVDDGEGESRAFEYYQLSRGRQPRGYDRDAYREQRPRREGRDIHEDVEILVRPLP